MLTESPHTAEFRKQLKLPDLHVVEAEATDRRQLRLIAAEYLDQLIENGQLKTDGNENHLKSDFQILEDIEQIPKLKVCAFSLSHCRQKNVFVLSQKCHGLGVDIEEFARITPAAVARISKAEELDLAPHAAHLWAAKEAAFKTLALTQQPSVISKVTIFDWQPTSKNSFHFRFKLNETNHLKIIGEGFCTTKNCLILSIAKI